MVLGLNCVIVCVETISADCIPNVFARTDMSNDFTNSVLQCDIAVFSLFGFGRV